MILSTHLYRLVFVSCWLVISSCQPILNKFESRKNKLIVPPGTIQLNESIFIDQTEITNLSWMEYLYYQANYFGKQSVVYQKCLPDTMQWYRIDSSLAYLSSSYLKNSRYQNFPVVGISLKQARAYSNWRSDRVFEAYLIKNNVIPYNTTKNKDSIFTINKYFSGQYLSIKPDTNFRTYPRYTLIDSTQFNELYNLCLPRLINQKKHLKYDSISFSKIIDGNNKKTTIYQSSQKNLGRDKIIHLMSNVCELTTHKGLIYGCNTIKIANKNKRLKQISSSEEKHHLIGFRNVCKYELWEFH